jgi:hypothetical protein
VVAAVRREEAGGAAADAPVPVATE